MHFHTLIQTNIHYGFFPAWSWLFRTIMSLLFLGGPRSRGIGQVASSYSFRSLLCAFQVQMLSSLGTWRFFQLTHVALVVDCVKLPGPLFPYGKTDFTRIREAGQFFVDNSRFIRELERHGENHILLRPPRFGKSLFANMLGTYYDKNTTLEQFDKLFGTLDIYKVCHLV